MTNQDKRKSFIIYKDSLSILNKLTAQQKADLFDAIADYQINSILPSDNLISIIFEPFLNQFKRDEEKWQNVRQVRIEAGSLGGKQKVANASKSKQKVANVAVSVSGSVSGSGNKKLFTPPTLQDVWDYCRERKSPVDAKKFFEYYSIANWKDQKGNQVKNWKQKLITWENRYKSTNNQAPVKSISQEKSQIEIIKDKLNSPKPSNYNQIMEISKTFTNADYRCQEGDKYYFFVQTKTEKESSDCKGLEIELFKLTGNQSTVYIISQELLNERAV